MTFRPAPLKTAAALAAGFVVVRVVYRVLFHGADGSGPVVLPLPELRLPPPFAHVVMFGPVTLDGLGDAAASAIPIALTILFFGLLNAVVDVARLFGRGARRGPLRGIARTLAVAWATLPALVDAVRAVRSAQRLRGERPGVRLLAPVLQRTLERAGAVAAALELRGLAGTPREGDCAVPVRVRDARLWHGEHPVVRADDLSLAPGTLTVLTGPTGSGKTTVLRALSGLHQHLDGGRSTGVVEVAALDRRDVPPRDTARLVGVVLQHPREGFTTERVADEIGLALQLRGVAREIIDARVAEVADRVGITDLLSEPVRGLSAGQATLVAIAAAVIERPVLLLVDEPLADLDAVFRARIVRLLAGLAHEAGVCVLVAEHRAAELSPEVDRWLTITADALLVEGAPVAARDKPVHRPTRSTGEVVLRARELSVHHGGRAALDGVSLAVEAGEIVAVVGPNGAGKSTLLTALALPPGAAVHAAGAVALVPDASDDLFLLDTVRGECRRADRRAHLPAGTTLARFAGFLDADADGPALAGLGVRHPRDLSTGQRRVLALTLQLARSPRVLLVDEPTRGLDARARDLLARTLGALAAQGTAVVIATHDAGFAAALAHRLLPIADGCLGASVTPPSSCRIETERGAPAGEPRKSGSGRRAPRLQPESGVPGQPHQPARPDRRGPAVHDRRGPALPVLGLLAVNAVALAAFAWPLIGAALPAQAQAAVPVIALALVPLAAVVVLALLDGTARSAQSLALLGTLAAIGAAIRVAGTGVGGVEAVFILLILAGRAFGPRFALVLGMLTIGLSSLMWGGIGPWTPFQMFACAWVGAGAGLLPRLRGRAEIALLCAYGVAASYAFGLVMNLWFWPFAVGAGTGISYEPGAPLPQNLTSFLLYTLVTSTATWDTLRAITTVLGIVLVGRAVLSALRRAKPVVAAPGRAASARASVPALR